MQKYSVLKYKRNANGATLRVADVWQHCLGFVWGWLLPVRGLSRALERGTMRVKSWSEEERQRDKGVSETQATLGRCTTSRPSTPRRPRPGETIKHTWHPSHYQQPPESVHHYRHHQRRLLAMGSNSTFGFPFPRWTNVISEYNSKVQGLNSLWAWWKVKLWYALK